MSKPSTIEPAGLSSSGKPLTTKTEPKLGIRVSKRAALLLAIPVALAGGVVIYNIFSRGDEPTLAPADKPKSVESAMDVAESINQKAERPVALSLPVAAPTDATPATTQPAGAGAAPRLPNTATVNEAPKTLTLAEQAAQRLADERLQRLQQAMDAATKTKSFREGEGGMQAGNNPAGGGINPSSNPYAALASAGFNPASLLGAGGMGKDDPNGQKDKSAFLQSAKTEIAAPILAASVKPAMSPFEINSGTVIPAVLVTGLNSDLPGSIIGQVSENVFDTATGNHLLIPKGAKLFGQYDSQVSYGQNRLLVAWQRVIFPNGSTLEIGGMGGVDKTGSAGFEDQVDNHYWRLFTGALLTSIFSAGIQLSQPQTSNNNGVQGTGQTIGAAVGQQIGQLGVSISQKNLAIAPTIVIRQGYRFSVMVDKDVVFPGAYQ
ncbi:MAG TPA: TrbI/VirB10 family protein [Halothiobacillus sp.]|nr:TrbI/VirB10 family protein [Halothiobacillus sp.]